MKLIDICTFKKPAKRRAQTIAAKSKYIAQKNNPTASDIPHGWRADPHQGTHNGINWR